MKTPKLWVIVDSAGELVDPHDAPYEGETANEAIDDTIFTQAEFRENDWRMALLTPELESKLIACD